MPSFQYLLYVDGQCRATSPSVARLCRFARQHYGRKADMEILVPSGARFLTWDRLERSWY